MKLVTLKKRLKGFANVKNMDGSSGKVPNQFEITFNNGKVFKSYHSIIAIKYKGKVYLTDKYNYSKTTMKYLKQFLGHGIGETRKAIKEGKYKLLN